MVALTRRDQRLYLSLAPCTYLPICSGRWVALDEHDNVVRDAETLTDLMAILDAEGVEGVSIMRAPVPGEPVVYGLG